MPSTTLPVPPQTGQSVPSCSPLPPQWGQIFSPVPGVPGAASSPGASGRLLMAAEPGRSGGGSPAETCVLGSGPSTVMKLLFPSVAALSSAALGTAPAHADELF